MASPRARKVSGSRRLPAAAAEDVAAGRALPRGVAGPDELAELAEALRACRTTATEIRDLEAKQAGCVAAARELGASWARIGVAVGLTRQGALKRWGAA
jgi:hypothetical protein